MQRFRGEASIHECLNHDGILRERSLASKLATWNMESLTFRLSDSNRSLIRTSVCTENYDVAIIHRLTTVHFGSMHRRRDMARPVTLDLHIVSALYRFGP